MNSIKQIKDLKGKRVLVRTDFNVPVAGPRVLDKTRILVALPTLEYLRKKGAKVIIMSHIGRDPEESLKPVYSVLKKYLPVKLMSEVLGEKVDAAIAAMKNGDVIMLENLRSNEGEKNNDPKFARALADLADIYVNEAFPVSHRADASLVGVPKYLPSYAGLQLEKEVAHLMKAHNPKHPFLFILGGAKAETKLPLLKRYLKEADYVFVGGVLANDILKARGFEVGKSLVEGTLPPLGSLLKSHKLLLPDTVVVVRKGKKVTIPLTEMTKEDDIFDVGLPSIDALAQVVKKAKLILWNGPMGYYEGGYVKGTEEVLQLLADARGETIIGGGDTSVLVERKKMADKFTFVSTGGGATLDFLAKGTLPGIKALK